MNFKTDLSNANQELLSQLGVEIEDRNYSTEEIKKCRKQRFRHRTMRITGWMIKNAPNNSVSVLIHLFLN